MLRRHFYSAGFAADICKKFLAMLVIAGTMSLFGAASVSRAADAGAKEEAAEEEKIPDPEDLDLKTADGVTLKATYFPSNLKKKAVPALLLHAYKGDRRDYEELAVLLQALGHAVLVPDLRGHGDSKEVVRLGKNREPTLEVVETAKLTKNDFEAMVLDTEAAKEFLRQENNEGRLNLDRLCVVGTDMGACVALNWAVINQNIPPLLTGKVGQDVKALVLISPDRNFKGIPIVKALDDVNVRTQLSVMIITGKGHAKSLDSANMVYKKFERYHPVPSEEEREKQDLFLITPQTSLQGAKMLNEKSLEIPKKIAGFIDLRLVKNKKLPEWTVRQDPH